MNIEAVINDVLNFFLHTRRNGYTRKMDELSKKEDFYILVVNEEDKENFKNPDKCVSISGLKNLEHQDKIILMDNHTILSILEESKRKIDFLQRDFDKNSEFQHEVIMALNKVKGYTEDRFNRGFFSRGY